MRQTDDVTEERTILQLAVERVGVHRGALAAASIAQWVLATEALGYVPSLHEYAKYWAVSDRTGERHGSRARAVLGDDWRTVVEQLTRYLVDERSPRAVIELVPRNLVTA